MNEFDHVKQVLALTLGVSWASGINLYAAVLALGVLGATGHMTLPPGLEVLASPVVIGAAGLMYVVEFFADKIPGVDSAWDVLHTFIRIPAGAILAAGAVGNVDPAFAVAAGLVGGVVAGAAHATKAGARLLINTSPEPFSNAIASVTEDAAVFGGVWMMVQKPGWFLVLFFALAGVTIWALPKLWRGVKVLASRVAGFLRGKGLGRDPQTPGMALAGTASARATGDADAEDQRPTV
jgi:hypothetical protein